MSSDLPMSTTNQDCMAWMRHARKLEADNERLRKALEAALEGFYAIEAHRGGAERGGVMQGKFNLIARVQNYGGLHVGLDISTTHHIFQIDCPELAELLREHSKSGSNVQVVGVEPIKENPQS